MSKIFFKVFKSYISVERFFMQFCSYVVKHIFKGFMSRLHAGILNFLAPTFYMALFAFLLFCDRSPSWRKNLSFGLLLFLKASLKCVSMKSANIYPLIFPKYCSHKITPLLKDIATIKCAILPPLPVWLPFAVQSGSKPSVRCRQVMLLTDLASSAGYTNVDSLLHPNRMICPLSRYFF